MSTRETIEKEVIVAMKARDAARLDVLRMLKTAIKNAEIEKMGEMSEEDVLATIAKEVKKQKDALATFESAGRSDLADAAKAEIAIMESYLPAQMSDEELRGIVKEEVDNLGVQSMKEFGKLMGAVMKRTQGRADGARVKQAIEQILAS